MLRVTTTTPVTPTVLEPRPLRFSSPEALAARARELLAQRADWLWDEDGALINGHRTDGTTCDCRYAEYHDTCKHRLAYRLAQQADARRLPCCSTCGVLLPPRQHGSICLRCVEAEQFGPGPEGA